MAIWTPTRPTVEDRISDIPGVLKENWETYGSATSAEHGPLGTGAMSGRHDLSGAGVCYYGTTTQIGALVTPPSGALAYDQTLGVLKRYWSSSWTPTTSAMWSRARWSMSGNNSNYPSELSSVDGDTQTIGLSFTNKIYDTAGEYLSATGKFVASADGNYLIGSCMTLDGSGSYPSPVTLASSAKADMLSAWSRPWISQDTYPSANGDTWQWDASYTYIDSYPDGSYSSGTYDGAYACSIPTCPGIASTMASGNVTLYAYVYGTNPIYTIQYYIAIKVGGTWYNSSLKTAAASTGWHWGSFGWATNPKTGVAWTGDELNGIGTNALTQIYIYTSNWASSVYPLRCDAMLLRFKYNYSTNWEYINEYPTANDNDYIEMSGGNTYRTGATCADVYSGGSTFSPPTLAQNISATVYIRAAGSTANSITATPVLSCGANSYIGYKSGNPDAVSGKVISGTTYNTYAFPFTHNPVTSAAWVNTDFAASSTNCLTGFGMALLCASPVTVSADVSQCYMVVDWTVPDPTTTLEIKKNGSTTLAKTYISNSMTSATQDYSIKALTVSQLITGDYVTFHLTKTVTDDKILTGTDTSYMFLHRIGASCL